jgi:D-beta-D-heptose 7-phosphate kinase/D-beta-D-heptose 1-phosphate adenosyltransferase
MSEQEQSLEPEKIVAVSGCFQIFHRGHLLLLCRARKYGKIIVLLNSDEAVLEMKGYLAEPFETRKQNLLDWGLVEEVMKIETDPAPALAQILPDFQVCGSDYDYDEVMQKGGEFVGEIIIVPYTEGVCSSDLYKESKCQKQSL